MVDCNRCRARNIRVVTNYSKDKDHPRHLDICTMCDRNLHAALDFCKQERIRPNIYNHSMQWLMDEWEIEYWLDERIDNDDDS